MDSLAVVLAAIIVGQDKTSSLFLSVLGIRNSLL